ncbi:filaggrin-like isoform X2 [Hylaeus volcanicus]|uniref:filaggrin-like isoform X2 n=1 Tax=Hylaeus volcanicus TaxID=313075 RepID=UPI0023B86534|nr:filaggrin-like isoform X2 [Hylaeus volcanicus]
MTIQGIVILLVSITQVLSAPSGCIESCSHSIKHFQVGSQTSGSIQNHDLTQTSARLEGLDYSKPGTWSEHNDYNTDNGNGKIHEERGQYVDGSKTVRYYKKNYSSSYNTGYPSGAELSEIEQENRHGVYVPNMEENINSQRTYDQVSNIGSMAQHSGTHSEHRESSIIRGNARSERLEDLGEYDTGSNTQISQNPFYTNTQPGNWSKVDSYRTDGGHGRVFEEEGQYVTGPKKIRYYKRNYTSSSGSSSGIPTLTTSRIGVHNLDRELENLQREIEQKLKQMSATTNMASSNIAQTNINMHGLTSDSLHNINSNVHRGHVNHGSSLFTTNHDEEQDYIQRTDTDIGPYKSPSQNIKDTRNSNMYENHEVYTTNQQPTIGHINVLNTGRSSYNKNIYSGGMTQQHRDNLQQTELLDSQQKKFVDDNLRQNTYNLNSPINSDTLGRFPHYKEQWSSSSHMQEISRPQHFADIPYINEQNAQYNNRYRENSFHSEHQSKLGKLMSGTLDLSQVGNNADCTHGTIEHVHTSSQHQTMYKRDAKSDESSDTQEYPTKQLSQQHQDFSAGANADMVQQTDQFDDFTQQTSGKLEFGQQSRSTYPQKPSGQHSEDLTQQTDDFGDFTQQTSGKLEFEQQSQNTYHPQKPRNENQHSEDLTQQTDDFGDLSQQTSGKLEFGQQSQSTYHPQKPRDENQHLEDLTQQTDDFGDFTQQTSGKLEFGQQSQSTYHPQKPSDENQYSGDLTQQTGDFEDFTQQASGKLEFGQQSQSTYHPQKPSTGNQHSDLSQQTDDFGDLTQQISGKLEFGQQPQNIYHPQKPSTGNQHSDLTQQTDDFGDLTQQTSGNLEFEQDSQHSYQPWNQGASPQYPEDLTQQTDECNDFTQQTSGKLEFGQQSEHSHHPRKPSTSNQHSDLTQQTDDFGDLTQQTTGNLDFEQDSQYSYQPWNPSTSNQQSEGLTQQTSKFSGGTIMNGQISENNVQNTNKFPDMSGANDVYGQQYSQQHNLEIPEEPQVSSTPFPKPAEKPKPRSRYSRTGFARNVQDAHNTNSQQTSNPDSSDTYAVNIDNTKNQSRHDQSTNDFINVGSSRHLSQQAAGNVFSVDGGNMDQSTSLHKSNDATVGLQWHYTYHPSDQRTFVQQIEQKDKEDLQQTSSNLDFHQSDHNLDQQETQNTYTFEDAYQQSTNGGNEDLQLSQKYQGESESMQQSHLEFGQQTVSETDNEQKYVQTSETEHHLEPRILEAYGGGPYDISHDDDIYRGVTINPSATLPPINSADPWDIREKPRVMVGTVNEATPTPMPVEPLDVNNITTEAPSFWSRVGNRLTNTFDKAKEKARSIFG